MVHTSSRTNLGPLTTTFTPGPDCTVNAYYGPRETGVFFQAQYCYQGTLRDQATCRPTATVTTPNPPLYAFGYYSPGLYCPSGYTSACASTAVPTGNPSGSNAFQFDYPLTRGETAIGCCPTGLGCDNSGGPQACARLVVSGSIYPAGYCGNSGPGFSEIGSVTIGPVTSGSSAIPQSAVVFAPLIQLVFQSSDLPMTLSSSTSASTSTLTAASTSSPGTGQNSQPSQDTGLSTGTKIGIGVGVPLAVLFVAAFGALFYLYRRERSKNRRPIDLGEHSMPRADKAVHNFRAPAEVDASAVNPSKHDAYRHGPVELNNTPYYQRSELPNSD